MDEKDFSADEAEILVDAGWERRSELREGEDLQLELAVRGVLGELDSGRLRIAEPQDDGSWRTNEWLKKAVLLSFRLCAEMRILGGGVYSDTGASDTGESGVSESAWWDKVPSKFVDWQARDFAKAGFRVVPGAWVRHSAYVASGVVLMPSFVNVAAHIGEGTMIDTWATVGSCAQVGRGCHISGGAGIGGVLEPTQAAPVIIEDGVFIGARSEVVEGVIVRAGAVLSMGVYIGATTKIVDRETGEIFYGEVPANAVVVPGTLPSPVADATTDDGRARPSLYCAVIIKRVDERTRSRTSLNELLRDPL
ncbi:MAG: 2,3,4,5-tetrahydropyridine-2,6-dicarboxylate N-succinyltransferase [Alphaproteobacteria bacterium]